MTPQTETTRSEAGQAAPATGPAEQTPPEQATAERRDEEARGQEKPTGGKVVHMHTAHPRVPIPYVTPGDMFTGARAGARAATSLLPSPRKLAYYGLLGGMAVAGAVEWPIAVAIGAATEVITREEAARRRAAEGEAGQRPQAATEPSARTTESARSAQAATA
ncbi:hypothetical protein [Streptomyces sp. 2A115]|uniref:hypothetical protein n=1 Tax=Streptomyces sp. 2A115 TaxID=3457439 RepID=UPI003FD423E0